jgi:ribokinase
MARYTLKGDDDSEATMILVAGSANLDFVVRAGHIPQPGETVLGHEFKTFPGGKGANQAVACARAGGAVTHMLAGLGQDAFAQPLVESLLGAGVVLHDVRSPDEPTGCAFICVSDEGENAITVAPGANSLLGPDHWHSKVGHLSGFTHLLMQLEIPLDTVLAYARAGQNAGMVVVLNAAPARPLPADLLALTDVLIVNEGELAEVAGHQGNIAQCLKRIGVPTVVVTLGHRGCCMRHGGHLVYQTGFSITPVDTTGAGDTFCGALVAALAHGSDAAAALEQACAAAALACLQLGAQSSIPTCNAVNAFLAAQAATDPDKLIALQTYCAAASV